MKLDFTKRENKYEVEFSASKGGIVIVNRKSSGSCIFYLKGEHTDYVAVNIETSKDFAVQLNIVGVTYKLVSENEVISAEFTGDAELVNG